MAGFDPYQRAWQTWEAGGISALAEREVALFVHDVPEDMSARIRGIPSDARLGFMVVADACPLDPEATKYLGEIPPTSRVHHLNVIGRRQVGYDELTPAERHAMDELAVVTGRHLREMVRPKHGIEVVRFGNQVPTAHLHVLSRSAPDHGLDWGIDRPLIPVADRWRREGPLAFGLEEPARIAVTRALLRFAEQ